uniref:Uncharacterized protein n=1 Tax=Eutreptiella gymnastica TaxID=73025 RepID=A0A7S4LLC3_9EUGL
MCSHKSLWPTSPEDIFHPRRPHVSYQMARPVLTYSKSNTTTRRSPGPLASNSAQDSTFCDYLAAVVGAMGALRNIERDSYQPKARPWGGGSKWAMTSGFEIISTILT